jgi:hypothetical protein
MIKLILAIVILFTYAILAVEYEEKERKRIFNRISKGRWRIIS